MLSESSPWTKTLRSARPPKTLPISCIKDICHERSEITRFRSTSSTTLKQQTQIFPSAVWICHLRNGSRSREHSVWAFFFFLTETPRKINSEWMNECMAFIKYWSIKLYFYLPTTKRSKLIFILNKILKQYGSRDWGERVDAKMFAKY